MFTGIVDLAKITNIQSSDSGWELTVESPAISPLVKIGDSVAIDGACLSVIKVEKDNMYFFASPETIDKTIIRNYLPDTKVNIELPMQPNGYLGGHYVLGHVDTTAIVSKITEADKAWFLNISIPSTFEKYVVYKGSIAINGVSLTINKVTNNSIELCIIPVTIAKTNLSFLKAGELVNIEFDILAKYTEQLLNKREVGNV
ncbi:riboflavin synthase [mine drainage metagenome]|uniref:Riboflavin synthase n=1 Tax=mine drainage metagenome TaxID=410659 RepID=A0A1J5RZG1_9ZZZZ